MRSFLPWVGNKYWSKGIKGIRVLILGESHYGDAGTETSDFTIDVVKMWGQTKRLAFFTKAQKLVLDIDADWITSEERVEFWNSVAFYNYVQSFPGPEPRFRPTTPMWAAAEAPFLSTLEELKPQLLIVLGLALSSWLPELPPNIRVCRIAHPSSSKCSYNAYQPIIRQAFQYLLKESNVSNA